MNITAWRISRPEYAARAFTGEGARRFGGRWNSKGTALGYAAASAALAALELLVHLPSHRVLEAYVLWSVTFSDSFVEEIAPAALPKNWRADPAPPELRRIGDEWASARRSAVLRVPSSIIDVEFNYLLNPAHADYAKIRIGAATPFRFDVRLR